MADYKDIPKEYREKLNVAIQAGDQKTIDLIASEIIKFGGKDLVAELKGISFSAANGGVTEAEAVKSAEKEREEKERESATISKENILGAPEGPNKDNFAIQNNLQLRKSASSSKRHILINSYSGANYSVYSERSFIDVSRSNDAQVADLEEVLSVVDNAVAGTLGATVTPTTIIGSGMHRLMYFNSGITQMTNITVEWVSGATKTFDVIVPGTNHPMWETFNPNIPILPPYIWPTAKGCGDDYTGFFDSQSGGADLNQYTKRYLSVKTHPQDPNNLYQDIIGYDDWSTALDISYSNTLGYNIYSPNKIKYNTRLGLMDYNGLLSAYDNFNLTGYDWDAVAGSRCTNQNYTDAVGVDPTTSQEQLHKTITFITPKMYNENNSGALLGDFNTWIRDAYVNNLISYSSIQTAMLNGSNIALNFTNNVTSQTFIQTVFPKVSPALTTIEYADNLICCNTANWPVFEVCLDQTSPSYYLDTTSTNYGFDCNNQAIDPNYLNGSSPANFVSGTNCCAVDCNSNFFTGAVSVNTTLATFGGSDGQIIVSVAPDANNVGFGLGTPWGAGNQYLFELSHPAVTITQTAPGAGGATFTVTNCTTVTAGQTTHVNIATAQRSDRITTGMTVTGTGIPADTFVGSIIDGQIGADGTAGVDTFQLVDINGLPVAATAAGTVTLTFAAGMNQTWGSLPFHNQPYTITVTDNAGCVTSFDVGIKQGAPILGCTDSTAINYDSTAQQDDGTCFHCTSTNGNILLSNGTNVDFGSGASNIITTASTNYPPYGNGSNNTGELTIDSSINAFIATYIVTATSTYTITLNSHTTYADSLSYSNPTQVAQQAGITLATGVNHTFTGLAVGYYSFHIEIEDSATGSPPGDDAGLEICYYNEPAIVPAQICTDQSATNYLGTLDANLIAPGSFYCTYNCNTTGTLSSSSPTGCNALLTLDILATTGIPPFDAANGNQTEVAVVWEYNGVAILGATEITNGYVNSINYQTTLDPSYVTADGTYTAIITTSHPNGNNCVETVDIFITLPICGCTDPAALNYDATATVDDGSCIMPSFNCVNYNCTDPLDGTGTFTTLAICQNGCIPPIGGCTDPLATNYDPSASFDDGSCTYQACLDPSAINNTYLYDCNGVYRPSATIIDNTCCQYCAGNEPVATSTSVVNASPSTGCLTNADGSFTATFDLALSVATCNYDVVITDVSGAVIYTESGISSGSSFTTGTILGAGVYIWTVTDLCTGCTANNTFAITATTPELGCTDPAAENYDPDATCDDGSCIYCGCTDPLANNYLPGAACDDGSCVYVIPTNPCMFTKRQKERVLNKVTTCVTRRGQSYLNKMKTGLIDDCSIMNSWKMILIKYLLESQGGELDCLFNCANGDSPASPPNTISCANIWEAGGPTTGVNDQGYAGSSITSGEGTTVFDPNLYFVVGNTVLQGDVIKMPSGNIWKMTQGGGCTWGCYNPETPQGASSGHWQLCQDANIFAAATSETYNYLDNFINFANKHCADCNTNF